MSRGYVGIFELKIKYKLIEAPLIKLWSLVLSFKFIALPSSYSTKSSPVQWMNFYFTKKRSNPVSLQSPRTTTSSVKQSELLKILFYLEMLLLELSRLLIRAGTFLSLLISWLLKSFPVLRISSSLRKTLPLTLPVYLHVTIWACVSMDWLVNCCYLMKL